MSWLHTCLNSLGWCQRRKPDTWVTEPPPSQPDKAPTEKDKNNDEQQQRAPKKRTPLSALEHAY